MNINKKAFTLVELIVVITILTILGTIAFISFQGYSKDSRNSVRVNDIALINKSLEIASIDLGKYPTPDLPLVEMTYLGGVVYEQGTFGEKSFTNVGKLDDIPVDPLTGDQYGYSRAKYGKAFETRAFYEDQLSSIDLSLDKSFADDSTKFNYIEGTYNGVTAKTFTGGINYVLALPSLFTSTGSSIDYLAAKSLISVNGTQKTYGSTFNHKVVWSGVKLPTDSLEIQSMMDQIVLAYSGTELENYSNIGQIISSTETPTYFHIGENIVNDDLGGEVVLGDNIQRTCDLDGGYSIQNWESGAWGTCNVQYCYGGFDLIANDCVWSGDLLLQANDPLIAQKEPQLSIKDVSGSDKFYQVGYNSYYLSALIPIDTAKSYEISGDFRSNGTTNSKLYYGIRTYDINKDNIHAIDVYRYGTEAIVNSFDDNTITTNLSLTGWAGAGSYVYQRLIGIYYDGDTSKLPDYVFKSDDFYNGKLYSTGSSDGAYSLTSGADILLNYPLPTDVASQIIPGVTKVLNHRSGLSWIYNYVNSNTPNTWQNFVSNPITGEDFGYYSEATPKFRTGTKYVRILILANYQQDNTTELLFDNLRFRELP